MSKPFSQACENNKAPILEVIRQYFTKPGMILEIGSGTGQHAVYFGEHLPHITWQTSDRQENLYAINLWVDEAQLKNVKLPLELDVAMPVWPVSEADGIFSANTVHIMSWPNVEEMLKGIGKILKPGKYFCLYGPFNYSGRFTSQSNAKFDAWLKDQDPLSGIRHFEDLEVLAAKSDLQFIDDHQLPANNRLLVWRKL